MACHCSSCGRVVDCGETYCPLCENDAICCEVKHLPKEESINRDQEGVLQTLKVAKKYKRSDPIRHLYFLGDLHLGVNACAENKIKEAVRTIKDDPLALWIGMGDYADFVTPGDIS